MDTDIQDDAGFAEDDVDEDEAEEVDLDNKRFLSKSAPSSPTLLGSKQKNLEKTSERRSRSGSLLNVEGTYTSPLQEEITEYVPTSEGEEEEHVTSDDFELLAVIGKGSFGKVLQVRKKNTGAIYAMKVIKKSTVIQKKQVAHTKVVMHQMPADDQAERDILLKIDYPFVVKLHYAFQSRDKLYLVLDFVNGGELFHHLRKEGKFSEERTRFYVAELVLAIAHLHSKNIIYRDFKAENILLDKSGHVVITDFGISKEMRDKDNRTNTLCGTPEYLAPEILKGEPHGKSVDWWSLGNLVYEMLSGSPPFYSKNVSNMYRNILFGELPLPESLSDEAKSFLLTRDVDKRLGSGPSGAEEVKMHAFFHGIDWDALEQKKIDPPFRPNVRDSLDLSQIDSQFTREKPRDTFSEADKSLDDDLFQGFSVSARKKIPHAKNPFRPDSLKLKLQQQIIQTKMKNSPSPTDDTKRSPLSKVPELVEDSPRTIMSGLPTSPHNSAMDSTLVNLARSLPDIHSALASLSVVPTSPESDKTDAQAPKPQPPPSSSKPSPFDDLDFDKIVDNFFSLPTPPPQQDPPTSEPIVSVTPQTTDEKPEVTPKPRLFKSISFYTQPTKKESDTLSTPKVPTPLPSLVIPPRATPTAPSEAVAQATPNATQPPTVSKSTPSSVSINPSLLKKQPGSFQICNQCGQDLNYIRQLEQQNSWLQLKLEESKMKIKKYKEQSKVSSFLASNANAPSVTSGAASGAQTPSSLNSSHTMIPTFDYERSIVEQVKKLRTMLLDQKNKVEHFYVQNLQKEREKLLLHQQLQEAQEQIHHLQHLLQQETEQRELEKQTSEQLEAERKKWAAQVLQMCLSIDDGDTDEDDTDSVSLGSFSSRSSQASSNPHKITF